jgi:hypothetical protein
MVMRLKGAVKVFVVADENPPAKTEGQVENVWALDFRFGTGSSGGDTGSAVSAIIENLMG